MRYVEAHCRKCDETFKISIGELSAEDARANLEAQATTNCPGHHVELSGPSNYWEIDWTDIKDNGKAPMTDEEWLAGYTDKFEHVVDTAGLGGVVDKVVGFAAGFCHVRRNGVDEYLDYANSPSGKRYYFVGST